MTEAPLVVTRVGLPAELDRFPGGTRARFGLGMLGALLAMLAPDLLLGEQSPFLWRVMLAGGLGSLSAALLVNALPWIRRRRLRRVVEWAGTGLPPGNANVRLAGTIEPLGRPFELPETSGLLVYASTRFHESARGKWAGAPAVEDVRGVPFQVRLDTGTVVRVPPDLLRLLDEPRELWGNGDEQHRALGLAWPGQRLAPITRVGLAPGDRVELVARLDREVAPHGQAAPGRGVPFALVAGPAWDGSVWVRRLSPT